MTSIMTPSEAQHDLKSNQLSCKDIEFINKCIYHDIAEATGHDEAIVEIPFSDGVSPLSLPTELAPAVIYQMELAGYAFAPKEMEVKDVFTFKASLDSGSISARDVASTDRNEELVNLYQESHRAETII